MSTTLAPGMALMEGQGAYNQHARQQEAAGGSGLALLQQAANLVEPPPHGPLLLADYGCSQGRNGLRPMRAAIAALRARFPARPICVAHTDLPGNDFPALFHTLLDDPASYLRDQPEVFPVAVGRSFYDSVLPPASVALGWSAMAAQWLSRLPAPIPGHFHQLCAAPPARAAFAAQGAADWRRFLALRARELQPSGRLVVVMPARPETGPQGIEPLFDAANDALAELVAAGCITPEERACMAIPDYVRSQSELLAPFAAGGEFAGLRVAHCSLVTAPDAMARAWRTPADSARLAAARAAFFRITFLPSLAAALRQPRPGFADALEAVLTRRLAGMHREIPQCLSLFVAVRQPG